MCKEAKVRVFGKMKWVMRIKRPDGETIYIPLSDKAAERLGHNTSVWVR